MVGFLATAYLAILLALAQYVLEFDPTLNPFRGPGEPVRLLRPHPVDKLIHQFKIWLCSKVLRVLHIIFKDANNAQEKQDMASPETEDNERFSEVYRVLQSAFPRLSNHDLGYSKHR